MHEVHCVNERHVMGARSQPQSPWILFFDGATRDSVGSNNNTNNPAGLGAVLKNGRGHTVVELKKLVGPGVSSGVAKYKALIAGLKKALSLGVEYLLVKGDSRLVHSQVVGHCSVQDDRLVEYQRKVMTLSKEFRAIFMERISKADNMRADRLANDAIDEELQVVDSLSEFIDQEWTSNEKHASQQHSVHTHPHPHPHPPSRPHTHPHTHPLPLPAPHLKVKPVASVSPHVVVKRHAGGADSNKTAAATRLFCSDEDSSSLQVQQPEQSSTRSHTQHVQAAAKSRRRHRLLMSAIPTKAPKISPSLLPHWDSPGLNFSPSSEESSTETSPVDSPATTTSTVTEQAGYRLPHDGARFNTLSSSSEESFSDAELSEQDYERLVKTLLTGFLHRKKSN